MRQAIVCAGLLLWCAGCQQAHGTDAAAVGAGGQAGDGAAPAPRDAASGSPDELEGSPSTTGPSDEPEPETNPMSAAGAAGTAGMIEPGGAGGSGGSDEPAPNVVPLPEGFHPNAMDECDLDSGWPGDEYCILPPPPEQGFQIHFGPSNYENPEPEYVLEPEEEWVHKLTTTSPNDTEIKFYIRQYRMRPGAHHTIVRDTTTGRRLSGANVNQDHPINGVIAPENAGVGIPMAAHVPITNDHHAINVTERPLLQEVWINFWYVDPAKVTETTTLLYDPGSISDTIAPHADVVMGPYECDIQKAGRLINMFGHVHANNVSFTAWRTRGGVRENIYEAYRWEEPLWLEYTSLAHNPVGDAASKTGGGWSGILDLQPGDTLGWECHEVNQQDTTLYFTNQTYKGWMCIIIGELVGTSCKNRSGIVFNPDLE